MRISDWSSDVCSSDLHSLKLRGKPGPQSLKICLQRRPARGVQKLALIVIFKPVILHDGRLGFVLVRRKPCLHPARDLMLFRPQQLRIDVGSHNKIPPGGYKDGGHPATLMCEGNRAATIRKREGWAKG